MTAFGVVWVISPFAGCKAEKRRSPGPEEPAVPLLVALASVPSGQLELTSTNSPISRFTLIQSQAGCHLGGPTRPDGIALNVGSPLPDRVQFRGFASGATSTAGSVRTMMQMDSPQPQAQWVWTYERSSQTQSFSLPPPATLNRASIEVASGKKTDAGTLPGTPFEFDEQSLTVHWSIGGTLQGTTLELIVVDDKATPVLTCGLQANSKEGSQIIDLSQITSGKTYLLTLELVSVTQIPAGAQSWIVKTMDWRNNNIVRKKIG